MEKKILKLMKDFIEIQSHTNFALNCLGLKAMPEDIKNIALLEGIC